MSDTPDWIKEIEDAEHSNPYPEGALKRMSNKQIRAERLKQIAIADDADLDDPAEELATRKLSYVLCELDRRGLKVS